MNFNLLHLFFFSFLAFSQEKKIWSLKECVNYAKDHNIEVLEALLKRDLSSSELLAAKMNFLPNLSIGSSYHYNLGLNVNPLTNQNVEEAFIQNRFFISSSVVLFDGLKNINYLKKSKLEKKLAESEIQELKLKLEAIVIEYFITILFSKESLKAAQEQVSISKNMHRQIEKRFNIGILSKRDLINSEAELAFSEKHLINSQNQLDMSKLKLALLLQLKEFKEFEVVDEEYFIDFYKLENLDLTYIQSKAFSLRPELKSRNLRYEVAKKALSIEKAAYWPTLSFDYRFSLFRNLFSSNNDLESREKGGANNFIISIDWPIFSRYFHKNNIQKAYLNEEIHRLGIEKTKNELRTTIYQAYIDIKNTSWTYKAAKKAENSSRLSFQYAKKSYENGVINVYEFSSAKKSWLEAQAKEIKCKYECLLKLKIMELYIGKLNF